MGNWPSPSPPYVGAVHRRTRRGDSDVPGHHPGATPSQRAVTAPGMRGGDDHARRLRSSALIFQVFGITIRRFGIAGGLILCRGDGHAARPAHDAGERVEVAEGRVKETAITPLACRCSPAQARFRRSSCCGPGAGDAGERLLPADRRRCSYRWSCCASAKGRAADGSTDFV